MEAEQHFNVFLSGDEIKELCFAGAFDAKIRGPSVDLYPDCIIRNGKEEKIGNGISIKPQEMFTVILKGNVTISRDCVGIAYPKTRLNQRGLHVLNTGIVEPGYSGYLSTVVMNFSRKHVEIRDSDAFLRLMVYRNREVYPNSKKEERTYDTYISYRKKESGDFPETFLDIQKHEAKIFSRLKKEISKSIFKTIGIYIAALSLIFNILFEILSYYSPEKSNDTPMNEQHLGAQNPAEDTADLRDRISALEKQINELIDEKSENAETESKPEA